LAVNNALAGGTLGYLNLSDNALSVPGYTSDSTNPSVIEDEITLPGSYTLPGSDTAPGGVYTFVDTDGAVTVTGSGTGDTLLAEGDGSSTTYDDVGGSNDIIFVSGDNTYNGDTSSSAGSDTIVAGSGSDSIYTGAGAALVYSGTGSALIDMQDTMTAGATSDPTSLNSADYNQFAILDDGTNTVYMNGVADVVIADAPGQVIFGGAGNDVIALVPPATAGGVYVAAPGNDTVVAGSGLTSVYDDSSNNIVWGEGGTLVVNFANDTEGTVVAGTGTTVVYGSAGDTINYVTTDSSGSAIFVGSAGESVDASGSAGALTMVLGTGNETLIGGSGPTMFNANYDSATGLTGSITINDFGGSDVFNFVDYSAADYQKALATGTVTSAGYQITLSDNTTVTFAGVTSISGHTTNT
jgi:hypothetical protein